MNPTNRYTCIIERIFFDSCVVVSTEQHYRLVPAEEVSPEDLALYRGRSV